MHRGTCTKQRMPTLDKTVIQHFNRNLSSLQTLLTFTWTAAEAAQVQAHSPLHQCGFKCPSFINFPSMSELSLLLSNCTEMSVVTYKKTKKKM